MNIQNSKLKFFSIVSGNDDDYQPIKNNFETFSLRSYECLKLQNDEKIMRSTGT